MSTTHEYTLAELVTAGAEPLSLKRKAMEAGYTNPSATFIWNTERKIEITVDEDSVVKATLLSDIEAEAVPSLSLDSSSISVTADGVATGTITVTDSRGASASGKTVKLRLIGMLPVDGLSVSLNGSGQGVFTFGPTSNRCNPRVVIFYYDTDEASEAEAMVAFS